MDIVFLLGSGISLDSGLPTTKCLTEFLFSKNFQSTSSERFISAKSDCSKVKGIKSFLSRLKSDYEIYVKKYTQVRTYELNYEDLYYLLEQLKSVDESHFKDYSIAHFKKWFQEKHNLNYAIYLGFIKSMLRFMNPLDKV